MPEPAQSPHETRTIHDKTIDIVRVVYPGGRTILYDVFVRTAEGTVELTTEGSLDHEPTDDEIVNLLLVTGDITGACILTGEDGENADDCTTHDHETHPAMFAGHPGVAVIGGDDIMYDHQLVGSEHPDFEFVAGKPVTEMHEHDLTDEEGRHIAHVTPAKAEDVFSVLFAPEDGSDGRSAPVWVRLADGTLLLGVFPEGDTYISIADKLGI